MCYMRAIRWVSGMASTARAISLDPESKINPDIQKERDTATFNTLELTYVLDGGREITERRRYVESLAFNDPDFNCKDVAFMTREEAYTNSIRIAILCIKKLKALDIHDIKEQMWYRSASARGNIPSMLLHESMFMHSVFTQTSEAQMVQWTSAAQEHTILGTYAQTEMGHGDFLGRYVAADLPGKAIVLTIMHMFRTTIADGNDIGQLGLHDTMVIHTLRNQTSEKQMAKWVGAAHNWEFIATYAQTELGHGTFLRGLETTATYDPTTEEFVLHSPTLTSMKWWPGNLGKSVTHAVVAAQLYTKGKCHGVHMFMVPLRSLEDHMPLPGIELGDIGPKMGYKSIDNGFLRFTHARIPRENMLMKYAQVEPEGTYVAPPAAKLSYGSMILIRSLIVGGMGRTLAQASTIAIRYSAVRRQSELIPGAGEPQVIDYQSQQLKLFPYLAMAFAFTFSGKQMQQMFAQSLDAVSDGNFNVLPELHATAAGLKAFTSSAATAGVELLRMACGGHGYSQASGFPLLYANEAPACTYEGENTVMLLQTARFLMKCVSALKSGNPAQGVMSYLAVPPQAHCSASSEADFLNPKVLLDAYRHKAQRIIMQTAENLANTEKSGVAKPLAWNQNHLYLIRAANAHCHLSVVQTFYSALESMDAPPAVRKAMMTMFHVYAIHGISENRGDFLQDGYLTGQQLDLIDRQLIHLLVEVRPNAVALVDSFDFHDKHMASVMGRYDGNVYENMYKWAKSAPMNQQEVKDAYHLYIQPFLKENIAQAKL